MCYCRFLISCLALGRVGKAVEWDKETMNLLQNEDSVFLEEKFRFRVSLPSGLNERFGGDRVDRGEQRKEEEGEERVVDLEEQRVE